MVIVYIDLVQFATRDSFDGNDVILYTKIFKGIVGRRGIGTSTKLGKRRVWSGAPDGGTMSMRVMADSWHDDRRWEEVVECGVGKV